MTAKLKPSSFLKAFFGITTVVKSRWYLQWTEGNLHIQMTAYAELHYKEIRSNRNSQNDTEESKWKHYLTAFCQWESDLTPFKKLYIEFMSVRSLTKIHSKETSWSPNLVTNFQINLSVKHLAARSYPGSIWTTGLTTLKEHQVVFPKDAVFKVQDCIMRISRNRQQHFQIWISELLQVSYFWCFHDLFHCPD